MAAAYPVRDHIPVLEEDEWFPEVERLTVEEGRAFFDEKVQATLGISGLPTPKPPALDRY